ncbi:MAG TPA: CBS domain-containing protein [Nitrososphaeria archaeon]|nr:CBS domain-containing protein [Nitrososphaeria archaeon]
MSMAITLRAKDVMDKRVVLVDRSEPVSSALRRMLDSGIWSVVVTDEGRPTAVLTERDFVRMCLIRGCEGALSVPAGDIATSPLVTCGPDDPVGYVWKLMVERSVRRVYVVDDGAIVGRVTQTGLFQKLLETFIALSQLVSP